MSSTQFPRSAIQVREQLSRQLQFDLSGTTLTKGAKGALVGALNKHLGGDVNRKLVLAWLFANNVKTPLSTHQLTEQQWNALADWVGMWKDEEANEWRVGSNFTFEAALVLTETIKAIQGLTNTERQSLGAQIDPLIDTAVQIGGVITHTDDNSILDTPKFDRLINKTTFGRLSNKDERDTGF